MFNEVIEFYYDKLKEGIMIITDIIFKILL